MTEPNKIEDPLRAEEAPLKADEVPGEASVKPQTYHNEGPQHGVEPSANAGKDRMCSLEDQPALSVPRERKDRSAMEIDELRVLGDGLSGFRRHLDDICQKGYKSADNVYLAGVCVAGIERAQKSVERLIRIRGLRREFADDLERWRPESGIQEDSRSPSARVQPIYIKPGHIARPLPSQRPPSAAQASKPDRDNASWQRLGSRHRHGADDRKSLYDGWRVTAASEAPKADIVRPMPKVRKE
jgi:hypothetical protein